MVRKESDMSTGRISHGTKIAFLAIFLFSGGFSAAAMGAAPGNAGHGDT